MNRIIACLVAAVLAGHTQPSLSQNYPAKSIRIIIPFAPGGGTDFIARVAAQKMTEAWGQQVIVDNRPGAGGTLGTELGVRAPADGYTFTMISSSYSVNPSLYKLTFDPINDITAVIQLSQGPMLLVVHPSLPAENVRELIALARAKPGSLIYASSGHGGITQLATELFNDMAGIKMIHVPYKGTGPALTDTISGQTQVLFGNVATTLPHIKSGRLKGIAVSTAKRIDAAPELPTVAESGLPGYESISCYGLIAPRNLPQPILDRVNGELNRILKLKEMSDRLAADGVSAAGGTPEAFLALIKRDIETWRRVVLKAGIKVE